MPRGFRYDTATPSQLARFGNHVVNDLIDRVPITVTHCEINSCTRVFSGKTSESLDVAVGGVRDGGMELVLDHERFLQHAPESPLADYPFEVMTWERWRFLHPGSDIYVGA